jgi:hypothetical protein
MAQVEKCLLSKHKLLSSNPRSALKGKKKSKLSFWHFPLAFTSLLTLCGRLTKVLAILKHPSPVLQD